MLHEQNMIKNQPKSVLEPPGTVLEASRNVLEASRKCPGRLQKKTECRRIAAVMQVEFEDDATVLLFPSAVLMKGGDPSMQLDQDGLMKCKTEPADRWPDTDDSFDKPQPVSSR